MLGVLFSNGQRETYSYAADGLRRKKVDISGNQDLYVWDEENLLLWTDQNFGFQNQYTQYPGQWGGMVSERHTGTSFFYGFDLAANTRFMAQISGSITDHYLYRAFGDGEVVSGSNFNPYQYGGQYGYYQEAIPVEGSQRYYVRARHLRVDLGRWVSRDPFWSPAEDRGPYAYAYNNPSDYLDPRGRKPARLVARPPGSVTGPARSADPCGRVWPEFPCSQRCHDYCQAAARDGFKNRGLNCITRVCNILCGTTIKPTLVFNPYTDWITCMNRCIYNHWKKQDTPLWKTAQAVCKSCGSGSIQCCLATTTAEQDGFTRCDMSDCLKDPPPPPGVRILGFPFGEGPKKRTDAIHQLCCFGPHGDDPRTKPSQPPSPILPDYGPGIAPDHF